MANEAINQAVERAREAAEAAPPPVASSSGSTTLRNAWICASVAIVMGCSP